MMHVLNPIHRHRKQKPQLCAPACLQMILDRRGIEYEGLGLEDLACDLGVYIDKRDMNMFGSRLRKRGLPKTDARIGLLFENFEIKEKQRMLKENYQLNVNVYRPSEIERTIKVKDFIINNLKKGNDIMMNYRWDPFRGTKNGHYVLVFAFDEENKNVYVADPSPFNAEYWKEKLGRFLYGMKPLWEEDDQIKRERGFVVFSGPIYRKKDKPSKITSFLGTIQKYVPTITTIRRDRPHPITHKTANNSRL